MNILENDNINMLLREAFYVLTAAMAVFICLEALKQGMVSAHIGLSWVLLLWLLVGILVVVVGNRKKG